VIGVDRGGVGRDDARLWRLCRVLEYREAHGEALDL
jgi:hypothetical protein